MLSSQRTIGLVEYFNSVAEELTGWAAVDTIGQINLSGVSIGNVQFLAFLKKQFVKYGIPTQSTEFEITKKISIANLSEATHFIHELKQLGCRLTLDDFGSGMSSFNHIGHIFGLETIAEFVENKTIQTQMKNIGVPSLGGLN